MAALGTYAENLIVDCLLRGIAPTVPSALYLALYLTNPTASDTGTEISFSGGSNYSRQPITFGASSGGSVANTGELDFPVAGATWGNVAFAAIRDAATSGHLLFYGPLVTPRFIAVGDVLKFLIGNVVCTVS